MKRDPGGQVKQGRDARGRPRAADSPGDEKGSTQSETQGTGNQDEIPEVSEDANLGGDPANHQQFEKQCKQTPQTQLPPRKASENVRRKFPFLRPARWRLRGLAAGRIEQADQIYIGLPARRRQTLRANSNRRKPLPAHPVPGRSRKETGGLPG